MRQFIFTNLILSLTFLSGIHHQLNAQPNYPVEPEKAELISTDISYFLEAYSLLKPGVDTIQILNTYYFGNASPGLTEYIGRHGLTPELLKEAIEKDPDTYDQIADFYASLPTLNQQYHELLIAYKEVIPNAMFAPTYLIVGANRGIAQASRVGQLVTISRVVDNPETLLLMIIHELTHFQQAMAVGPAQYGALYQKTDNMLELFLREGGAEFITFLVAGDITQQRSLRYMIAHTEELNQRFLEDLANQDQSYWLWESIGKDKDQHLLGYVMGFRICQAYYDKAADKDLALQNILGMPDAAEFMETSGYFK